MQFPKDFLWGTATSAHQTEGNNTNSDWWKWETANNEKGEHPLEPSGEACDSFNRYDEDLELCRTANNNVIRLSVEWARIEPREGIFDNKAFEHYRKVLKTAKDKGLKTFVTLHHFTNPIWFSKKGGWTNFTSPKLFAGYAQRTVRELGEYADFFMTINEPQVYASMSYVVGTWPPYKKNIFKAALVVFNMTAAHNKAYKMIKQISGKPLGIVVNVAWYEYSLHTFLDKIVAKIMYFLNTDIILRPVSKYCDFIGLNYYFTNRIVKLRQQNPLEPVSDLGWWINYEGLYHVLLDLKKYNKPVYITENGIADEKDDKRTDFIKKMLAQVYSAINHGVKIKGYFYWSLLDNYEWPHGFWPKFGLVGIDRQNNLKRTPRKSFYEYAKICENGVVDS